MSHVSTGSVTNRNEPERVRVPSSGMPGKRPARSGPGANVHGGVPDKPERPFDASHNTLVLDMAGCYEMPLDPLSAGVKSFKAFVFPKHRVTHALGKPGANQIHPILLPTTPKLRIVIRSILTEVCSHSHSRTRCRIWFVDCFVLGIQ